MKFLIWSPSIDNGYASKTTHDYDYSMNLRGRKKSPSLFMYCQYHITRIICSTELACEWLKCNLFLKKYERNGFLCWHQCNCFPVRCFVQYRPIQLDSTKMSIQNIISCTKRMGRTPYTKKENCQRCSFCMSSDKKTSDDFVVEIDMNYPDGLIAHTYGE